MPLNESSPLQNLQDVLSTVQPVLNRKYSEDDALYRGALLYIKAVLPLYESAPALIPQFEWQLISHFFDHDWKSEVLGVYAADLIIPIITLIKERDDAGFKAQSKDFSKVANQVFYSICTILNEPEKRLRARPDVDGKFVAWLLQVNDLLRVLDKDQNHSRLELIQSVLMTVSADEYLSEKMLFDKTSATAVAIQKKQPYKSLFKDFENTPVDGYYLPSEEKKSFRKKQAEPVLTKINYPTHFRGVLEAYYLEGKLNGEHFDKACRFIFFTATDKVGAVRDFFTQLRGLYQSNPQKQREIICSNIMVFPSFPLAFVPPKLLSQGLCEIAFNLEPTTPLGDEEGDWYYSQFQLNLAYRKYGDMRGFLNESFVTKKNGRNLHSMIDNISDICAGEMHSIGPMEVDRAVNTHLPLFLTLRFATMPPQMQAVFKKCIAVWDELNQKQSEGQRLSFVVFLFEHQFALLELINLMGEQGILYLQKQAANTLLPVERTLRLMEVGKPLSPRLFQALQIAFTQQTAGQKKPNEVAEGFFNCLIILKLLTNVDCKAEEIFLQQLTIAPDIPPNTLFVVLATQLVQSLMAEEGAAPNEQEVLTVMARFSAKELMQLFSATKKMSDDDYQAVYLQLLKYDCYGSEAEVEQFLHDTGQDNVLGAAIARHNEGIRSQLAAHHVDAAMALSYPRTCDLLVDKTGAVIEQLKHNSPRLTLWSYL